MTDTSLDRIISEEQFAGALGSEAEMFFRIANSLQYHSQPLQRSQHLFQLGIESNILESFLDDHGAKNNQTYCFFRELVASIRGFARVGFALEHLQRRFDSYGTILKDLPERYSAFEEAMSNSSEFVIDTIFALLDAVRLEGGVIGLQMVDKLFPEERYTRGLIHLQLPHNLGDERIEDDGQKIAEVASKFLQVCAMFREIGVTPIDDEERRERFFIKDCTEERARVYEATVHNLQSAYDTYIRGTNLEGTDDRLRGLRGHASAAFHLLKSVTGLTHFVERHESGTRNDEQKQRMGALVNRSKVRDMTLNQLLVWASELVLLGEPLAREILSSFSTLQELNLEVPEGITIHARPASLVVAIVNHYEMPVEMEVAGNVCNAASILEVLINAGSNPDERRYVFRGDARPLADLRALFEAGLGEEGLDKLPEGLSYLTE